MDKSEHLEKIRSISVDNSVNVLGNFCWQSVDGRFVHKDAKRINGSFTHGGKLWKIWNCGCGMWKYPDAIHSYPQVIHKLWIILCKLTKIH